MVVEQQVNPESSSFIKKRRTFVWLFFISLVAYIIFLLVYSVQSQEKLKKAAEERFYIEVKNTASILKNFLQEQKSLVELIANGDEVENYLTNQALGMSLEYGLNVNLFAIKSSFEKKILNLRWLDEPIYDRIIFIDENNNVTVDTQANASTKPLLDVPNSISPSYFIDEANRCLIFQAPVSYRGLSKGRIIAIAKLDLLFKPIDFHQKESNLYQFFIFNTNQRLYKVGNDILKQNESRVVVFPNDRLVPYKSEYDYLTKSLINVKTFDSYYLLKTSLDNENFLLITAATSDRIYGQLTSNIFLYLASLVPIILIIGLITYHQMRKKTIELETNVKISSQNINELADANTLLAEEINRRNILERDLRESEERYRTYIDQAPEGILVVDENQCIVEINPSLCNLLGLKKNQLLGKSIIHLTFEEDKEEFLQQFNKFIENRTNVDELNFITQSKAKIVMQLKTINLPNKLTMSFCVDITQKKVDENNIHMLAYYDALTGLPNRRLLQDRLRQALVTSKRDNEYVVLMMLDLDNFKNLNDTMGHDLGDLLLTMVAQRLTMCMRESDVVSRIGGDEFIVIAERLGSNVNKALFEAKKIANKLIQEISQPYPLEKNKPHYFLTCSFGLTLFKGADLSTETLIKQADLALYQAKNDGRNNYKFFNPKMQEAIQQRANMEAALRRAIDNHQLRLFCQPLVDNTGKLVGGEILLRWFLEDGLKPVMPNDFIPLAESSALILPIGDWVIEQSIQYLKKWQSIDRAKDLRLSINISARQFLQSSFVQNIRNLIERYEINPRLIKLELTESSIIEKLEEVIPKMKELNTIGIEFSLDDFGTGFSSLSYLKILPISQVKIDQSFVRDINTDPNDAAIVSAIVAICQSLKLEVVAEGVENQSQLQFLIDKGCYLYQGYLFGKPIPVEDFIV